MRCIRTFRILFGLLLFLPLVATMSAQQAGRAALEPNQATKLAELMCRQLPNAATVLEISRDQGANVGPAKEPFVTDDVHDALVRLGPYAVPCLVDRLTDAR
jgi:hypothetical protein